MVGWVDSAPGPRPVASVGTTRRQMTSKPRVPAIRSIVASAAGGEAPEVRSYLIEDGQVREVALEVE